LKKVLIVSPHFVPLNAPDMQRVRMSLRHYESNGWEPVVLALGDRWQEGVREPELEATVPSTVRIVRTRAIPRWFSRIFGLGNTGLRAWPFFLWRGMRLLATEKFDLVFFSNTQFITFTLGRIWRAWFGVPYVIDIQDPWRTDYYERPGSRKPPGGWKYQLARAQAWALEGWAFRRAAGVISVSPDYLSDLRTRYAYFEALPSAVIGFGATPDDLACARLRPTLAPTFRRDAGEIHFVYTGAAGPVTPHSLTVLFDSLRLYRAQQPERARRLRFHFIGTSYVAPGAGKFSVLPLATSCGVADQVEEIPHRVGHLEALRWQLDADALVLPGSSDLAYSPSKIYPYFLSERPILGLVFRGSVMERLLDELHCAYLVRYTEDEPKAPAHHEVSRFFDLAIAGFPPGSLPVRNAAHFNAHYLAAELTRRQCALFQSALGFGSAPRAPTLESDVKSRA
jgi:hypothetical protein